MRGRRVLGRGGGGVLCRGSLSYRGSTPPLHHHPVCQSWPRLKACLQSTGFKSQTQTVCRHTNTHVNMASWTHAPTHTYWVHTLTHQFEIIYYNTVVQMHKLYMSGVTQHKCTCSLTKILMYAHRYISTQWLHASHTHLRPRQTTTYCAWLGTD